MDVHTIFNFGTFDEYKNYIIDCCTKINNIQTVEKGIGTEERMLCCICLDNVKTHITIPCAHFSYCKICINKLDKCALCNKKIKNTYKVFC